MKYLEKLISMEEKIIQNAGKVLLEIYLIWKAENHVPNFKKLLEVTKIDEAELKRALKYCHEKDFIVGLRMMDGRFLIKDITARGIDIIESPQDKMGKRPFNVTFNFNTNFDIESIIKGEAKLF